MERVGAAVVEEGDPRIGDEVVPVGRPALVAVPRRHVRNGGLVPTRHSHEPGLQRRIEPRDLPERTRVRLAHEGVAEHADPDFVCHLSVR